MTIEQKHQNMGEQPIFSCKAHVFHIDPKTKRSWLPASSSAVSVSFFYDSTRMLYRIISVEGTKAVINSTVTPAMTFTKTSQKFGQWSDLRANTVYGLGFPNEAELNVFIEKFNEVKAATIESAKVAASNGGIASVPTGIQVQPNVPIPPANIIQRAPSPGGLGSTGTSLSESSMLNAHVPGDSSAILDGSSTMLKGGGLSASSPAATAHQRSHSLSGVQQADSPKKLDLTKGLPPGATAEAQLKYENERLKLALAQSSANAKKWEIELQTLKNNNARLTSALQESTANVEEWKRQLHSYKEENQRLKSRIIEIEAGRGNPEAASEIKKEMSLLKSEVDSLSEEMRMKDEEIRRLTCQLSERPVGDSESLKTLQMENEKWRQKYDTAIGTQESQRRVFETLVQQLGLRVKEIDSIQREFEAGLQT